MLGEKKLNPYLITSTKFNFRLKCGKNTHKLSRIALSNRVFCDDGNLSICMVQYKSQVATEYLKAADAIEEVNFKFSFHFN